MKLFMKFRAAQSGPVSLVQQHVAPQNSPRFSELILHLAERRALGVQMMGDGPAEGSPGIRTFLIADVRGYTLFTQERGDEAAAKLAARFAEIAREIVEEHGGSVIELRGDEALCAFTSARQAILAAVDAQDRFLEESIADPTLPLPVGIGLDVGEAVPVEGGYRGGALNLAARLCGQARAGEILASQGVVHLARKVDGVRTEDRGELHLKNLTEPVHAVRLVSERADPAIAIRPFTSSPPHTVRPRSGSRRPTRRSRRSWRWRCSPSSRSPWASQRVPTRRRLRSSATRSP